MSLHIPFEIVKIKINNITNSGDIVEQGRTRRGLEQKRGKQLEDRNLHNKWHYNVFFPPIIRVIKLGRDRLVRIRSTHEKPRTMDETILGTNTRKIRLTKGANFK
jgi:hypothetical protein